MEATIEIFLCYAHEDEKYRQQLQKQLRVFQRQQLISVWYDRDISPGEEWEKEIHAHLSTAQIVLLLVSPDFMASDFSYGVEMRIALERHTRGESRVIPIIVRPVPWQDGPLGTLLALPKDGKPINSAIWHNQDEAFFNVAEGIRRVIGEVQAQSSISTSSLQQQEKNERTDFLEQEDLSETFSVEDKAYQERAELNVPEGVSQKLIHSPEVTEKRKHLSAGKVSTRKAKHPRTRVLLISGAIFLVLALSLVPFLPSPVCSFIFCRSSQQPSQKRYEAQALLKQHIRVVSPTYVFSGNPQSSPTGNTLPRNIGAVLLAENTSTYYHILFDVQNVRHTGADILINSLALKLLSIPALPRPLNVWTQPLPQPGASSTNGTYPYPVTYRGQTPGQLLYAIPPVNLILPPEEINQLSIQVMSIVTAHLQFQVQVFYRIGNANTSSMLTLPQTFQVVFSDTSNWQEYLLQNGSLVKKA
jgi:hypothetical protein